MCIRDSACTVTQNNQYIVDSALISGSNAGLGETCEFFTTSSYDLERNVNLIKFSQGKIDIAFNENLSKNFVRNLSEKLLEWTSKRWVITLAQGKSQKTFTETKTIKKNQQLEDEKKNHLYKKFKNILPDAKMVEILMFIMIRDSLSHVLF